MRKGKAQSFARGPCGTCIPKSEAVQLCLLGVLFPVALNLELASLNIHFPDLLLSLAAKGHQIFIPSS